MRLERDVLADVDLGFLVFGGQNLRRLQDSDIPVLLELLHQGGQVVELYARNLDRFSKYAE